jgi:CheY-like chemotaxis protein
MPTILIVEDNEMNRDMLSRRLQRKGYAVLMAVDGAQGVALAQAEGPDVILMDMSLPVLDGWDATRQLKTAPQTAAIPILALTAHAMAGDREKAMAAGCDDYDTKPIELPRLLGKIDVLLEKKVPS